MKASTYEDLVSILTLIFLLIVVNFIIYMIYNRYYKTKPYSREETAPRGFNAPLAFEGFEDAATAETQADQSKYEWLDNTALYDDFYADLYDKLTQRDKIAQAEVVKITELFKKNAPSIRPEEWIILDAGCGTGITTATLAAYNPTRVIGVDKSEAMIRRARTKTIPATKLSPEQIERIEFRVADLNSPSILKEGQVTHAVCTYFTLYYIPDLSTFFQNMFYWVRPGGVLVVQVVNKYKFDPMLEAAAPTVFSFQKYSKERIKKSVVAFDKMDYEAEFDLDEEGGGDAAEFRETFRFKDGTVRRQKHTFKMPDLKVVVSKATAAGWAYRGFQDLTPIGFEYAYFMVFTRP